MKLIFKRVDILKAIFFFIFLSNLDITGSDNRGIIIQEVLIIFYILINLKRIITNSIGLCLGAFLVLIPFVSYVNVLNINEFLGSYISWVIYGLFILSIYLEKLSRADIIQIIVSLTKGINILIYFGFVQFIVRVFEINSLLRIVNNPFGIFTFSRVLGVSRFNGYDRMNSLCYEASVFGLICLIGYCAYEFINSVQKDYIKKIYKFMYIIGIFFSMSAATILGFLVIIIVKKMVNNKNGIKWIVSSVLTFVIVKLGISIFFVRIQEILIVGTSGFYRLIAPVMLIKDTILNDISLGQGLGQAKDYIINGGYYYFYKNGEIGKTIDNSIYAIILAFGIISIPILIYWLIYLVKGVNKKTNIELFLCLILIYLTTGGFNFIYCNIILSIYLLTVKYGKITNISLKGEL